MNTPEQRKRLVAAASTAWRPPRDPLSGQLAYHPNWYDLDEAGREALFEATATMRQLEAGLDPEGLSTTVRAVLSRLKR